MASEEQRNIEFIQSVQTYPCLYDSSNPDYSRRDICEKAWSRVGSEAKLSVTECKEKWKNLRTAFTRSQKKLRFRLPNTKRKYYLSDVMSFIIPFIKTRENAVYLPLKQTENEPKSSECSEAAIEHIQLDEPDLEIQSSEDGGDERSCESEHIEQPTNQEPRCFKKPDHSYRNSSSSTFQAENSIVDEADKYVIDFVKRQNNDIANNADRDFLKSVLPDMHKLSDRRKRKFKRLTLDLIDNLLIEQEDEESDNKRLRILTPASSTKSWDGSNEMVHKRATSASQQTSYHTRKKSNTYCKSYSEQSCEVPDVVKQDAKIDIIPHDTNLDWNLCDTVTDSSNLVYVKEETT